MSCSEREPLLHPPSPAAEGGWTLGYACVLGVVVSWVVQSEVVQCLQTALCLGVDHPFDKPYFLTWARAADPCDEPPPVKVVGKLRMLQLASLLAAVYFLGDYVWYIGLPYTTVAMGTIFFNTSCLFVCIFSAVFLHERMTPVKVVAVLVAFAGAVLLSASHHPAAHSSSRFVRSTSAHGLFGNSCAVVSACLYALYEVFFTKFIRNECNAVTLASVTEVTGYIGTANLCLLWVGIPLVANAPGFLRESWEEGPPTKADLLILALNGCLALGFNATLLLAVALTSPLVATLGAMLTIPLSATLDYAWHGSAFSPVDVVGSAVMVAAFGALSVASLRDKEP